MAAAGGGGGGGDVARVLMMPSDELLDCKTYVQNFMQMLGLGPAQTHNFMTLIMNPLKPEMNELLNYIIHGIRVFQNIPRLSNGTGEFIPLLRADGKQAEGSFGKIFINHEKTIICKEVPIQKKFPDGKSYQLLPMILQETFIQYVAASVMPDFVIPIRGIRRSLDGTMFYIFMDYAPTDLFGYLESKVKVIDRKWTLPTADIVPIFRQLFSKLMHINSMLNFVHRDLKSDNLVMVDGQVKMIDFGYSCISMRVNGVDYNIKTSNPMYLASTDCKSQQDMLVFFSEMMVTFYSIMEGDMQSYFDRMMGPNLAPRFKIQIPEARPREDRVVYNRNGRYSSGPAIHLTPEYVLQELNRVFAIATVGSPVRGPQLGRKTEFTGVEEPMRIYGSPFEEPPKTPVRGPPAGPQRALPPGSPLLRKAVLAAAGRAIAGNQQGIGTPPRGGGRRTRCRRTRTRRSRGR